LAATALVGCGGDDGGGGGGGGDSAGGTIKLRAIAAVGSGLTNYPDVEAGAKAAAKALNDAGGVKGKKIELSFCNTRGTANGATTCARGAVKDKVAAVVGKVDIFSTQSTPVLAKGGIPDIGNLPATGDIDGTSPNSNPLHSGNFGSFVAAPQACKNAGRKKMAIVFIDLASALSQASSIEEVAKKVGMPSAGVIKVPAQGVTDYSSYAQQIKDRGADCAIVALGPQAGQALFKAVDALGVDVQLSGTVFSYGDSEFKAIGKAGDGIWAFSPFPSVTDESVAGIKAFNDQLDAAGVAQDPVLRRAAGLNAWLAVQGAAKVAETIDGDVTAESMTAALKQARGIDLQGLVTWSPGDLGTGGKFARLQPAKYNVLVAKDGALVPSGEDAIDDPLKTLR
jgi:ABC-type branched-subunit amino acid transport system substrate-binding protein